MSNTSKKKNRRKAYEKAKMVLSNNVPQAYRRSIKLTTERAVKILKRVQRMKKK